MQEFNSPFAIEEPKNIPAGRYTLTQITECIADHYKDKQMYTSQVLADRVKIDKKLMGVYILCLIGQFDNRFKKQLTPLK